MKSKTLAMSITSIFSLRSVHGFQAATSRFVSAAPRRHNTRLFSSNKRLFPEEVNIIYDSKCNVCKLEIDFLRRRDERLAQKRADESGSSAQPRLKFTDLESGNYDKLDPANGGISYEVGMASMHAVTKDGKVMNGVPVFSMAYEQVNLGWLFVVTKVPGVKFIADRAYNIFAKYRTNITRGQSVDSLIQAYQEKRALEELQQADDCDACQETQKQSRKITATKKMKRR